MYNVMLNIFAIFFLNNRQIQLDIYFVEKIAMTKSVFSEIYSKTITEKNSRLIKNYIFS